MTWVKICGMTNLEDALVAADAGADAVGFVFYEKSPRYVTVETVSEIAEKLPENVEKVGVFVNGVGRDHVLFVAAKLTGVQTYIVPGELPVGVATGDIFGQTLRVLTALPLAQLIESGTSIDRLAQDFEHLRDRLPTSPGVPTFAEFTFVLDSGATGSPGGTGKALDWKKIAPITDGMRRGGSKFVIAGGLTPENVHTAMEILHPWGVDVVSGVEASPGKKDPEKVRAFVRAVREWDRKVS